MAEGLKSLKYSNKKWLSWLPARSFVIGCLGQRGKWLTSRKRVHIVVLSNEKRGELLHQHPPHLPDIKFQTSGQNSGTWLMTSVILLVGSALLTTVSLLESADEDDEEDDDDDVEDKRDGYDDKPGRGLEWDGRLN
ncbi:hypothetical protein HELRODRAFT_167177 [Helobdella robusta]|uniref:Uncharacterized protein n=1 Tax=Helobdella robusta TaxID=6412 RepID=T1EZ36_HELRO|nr:hypothetical protein HELRODRAFT_167177 [Helobdella robusta]ESO10684.1 hypothetical protein HELRODRAFT_167177 [Helobdella robusta]